MNHSFTNKTSSHSAIYIMQQWQLFMDGLDRIVGFYKVHDQFNGLEWINSSYENHTRTLEVDGELSNQINRISQERLLYQWLRPDLLPFTDKKTLGISQLDMFSEKQHLVLLVRLNEDKDNTCLFYLFFRNNQSNFGISDSQTELDTSHKAIIGKMASSFASNTMANHLKTLSKEKSFKERTKTIIEHKSQEVESINDHFNKWKTEWIDNYLSEISQRDGFNYVISDKGRNKLLDKAVDYPSLKKSIDETVVYICELDDFVLGDDIFIEDSFIIINQSNNKALHVEQPAINTRIGKTMQLLDRLENAALGLYNKGRSITSADVGAHMEKPITAPAISDALRKNSTRIHQLFEQYPSRWQTIRRHFKPIMNLSSKKNGYLRFSS